MPPLAGELSFGLSLSAPLQGVRIQLQVLEQLDLQPDQGVVIEVFSGASLFKTNIPRICTAYE
jgi:hypothetical protein